MGSFALDRGPSNPGLARGGACVSCTTLILWQWQQEYHIIIWLDDGNRIIIPQGNFKIFQSVQLVEVMVH